MRKVIVILMAGGLALFTSTAVADEAEFGIFRIDKDHNGIPDFFLADIDLHSATATAVAMSSDGGDNWDSFDTDGGGNFWLGRDEDDATLGDLLDAIKGDKLLRITHSGANSPSTYSFTVSDSQADINPRFPNPIPEITSINLPANPATMSWDWTGDPIQVDYLEVEVDGHIGGNWEEIYEKSSFDDPPDHIGKDILQVNDILFPQPPGNYDFLEFAVEYANITLIGSGNEKAILDWQLESGDELFGDGDVIEYFASSDSVPEPASMTLLALGGLALLRRRRPKG